MKRFFDTELETLRSDLFRMGEIVIEQLQAALQAFAARDPQLAQQVVDRDDELDELEVRIDEEAIRYMSLRTPVATELRSVITGMKAGNDLERAGDEITKIARRVRNLGGDAPPLVSDEILSMGGIAIDMLREALSCFAQETDQKALALCARDTEVDEMNRQVHARLTELMTREPGVVARAVDIMFISKAIERIADHATNIAEETIYLHNARDVRHSPEVKGRAPAG